MFACSVFNLILCQADLYIAVCYTLPIFWYVKM